MRLVSNIRPELPGPRSARLWKRIRQFRLSLRAASPSDSGQALVAFSLMIFSFTLLVALTADVGMAYRERSNVQGASDAAALAAAGILYGGGSEAEAIQGAVDIAEANGYVDGENGVEVRVNLPPDSGQHAGRAGFAEVEIDSSSDAYFATIASISVFEIDARAVAGGVHSNSAYGIISLNPTICKAIDLNGTIDIHIEAAGIFVNSNCPTDAFWATGTVTVNTGTNAVVGGWDSEGVVTINPTPTSVAPITDPLTALPVPVPPTNVMTCPPAVFSGTITLAPGLYECTIDPSGPQSIIFQPGNYHITGGVVADGGGNITFNAGEYTLGGVGLKVTGSGRITANEALLYIDEGELELTGNGVTRLIAPTTGVYAGISVFQNRTLTTQVDLKGTSLTSGSGTIYAAGAKVTLVGTSNSSNIQIISDTFQMSGTSSLDIVFDDNVPVFDSFLRLVE